MQCPICSEAMTEIKVAPCFDCGHESSELEELKNGEHEYHLFKVLGEKIVLCDFCDADFDSYYPEYLGFPDSIAHNYPLELVSKIQSPVPATDYLCSKCQHRLAFLRFLKSLRQRNAS